MHLYVLKYKYRLKVKEIKIMNKITPERAGIKSEYVTKYINTLLKRELHMHSVLMMRGNDIFCEGYFAPFNADMPHRMYSVTKSFVSVAIGLCAEDGLIALDDKIVDYFLDKIEAPLCESLREQTIREMLKMTTAGLDVEWFFQDDPDRTHLYFTDRGERRPSGTAWSYDSAGSQVLASLVERVTKKPLFEFLTERIFKHIGAFENAKILQTRNGDAWGDSAMICTTRDLAIFARFVMNYGTWNGKRLMNEEYLRLATTKQACNKTSPHYQIIHNGYGYQFWITEQNAFAFVGMGDQLALCVPEKDFIFVCTADNQGNEFATEFIIRALFDIVIDNLEPSSLPENEQAAATLDEICSGLELYHTSGMEDSFMREELNGKKYECSANYAKWKWFRFDFESAKAGKLTYENENGEMEIEFYVNENRFGLFPELGYSRERGGERTTDGFKYKMATSFAWLTEKKIEIFTQIIDEYLGNLFMTFDFKNDKCTVALDHTAEDFLWEYKGYIPARRR